MLTKTTCGKRALNVHTPGELARTPARAASRICARAHAVLTQAH